VCLNVEIKQREPDVAEPFWRFIDERGLRDRFIVAAERHDLMRRFRRVSRGTVATSASRKEVLAFWAASRVGLDRWLTPRFDALQVPETSGRLTVVDSRLVEAAHSHGVQVHVWTVDDPGNMGRLLRLGVDGLMSDRPDSMRLVLDEPGAIGQGDALGSR
jgi:glycerophosphoryl diester phosphodiesterase